jgi:predicted class III extradiol MEMO1 family dioxygenase
MPVDASFIAALLQGEDQSASSAENTATVRQTDAPNTSPSALFKADQAAHLGEHAIEVILPFLQEIAPQAAIVPICVADYNLEHLRRAGKLLAETIARRDARFSKKLDKENENGGKPGSDKTDNRRRICLITSSDMNHFLPHEQNMRLDALALDRLRAMDPEGLFKVVREKGISMCGFAPACLMLFACLELGAKNCRVTAHTSSGITGQSFGADMGRVVGYAGALID